VDLFLAYLAKAFGSFIAIAITFIILPTSRPLDFVIRVFLAIAVVEMGGEAVVLKHFEWGTEMASMAQIIAVITVWAGIGILRFATSRKKVLDDAERLIKAWRGK
jgi:hypothetical protein